MLPKIQCIMRFSIIKQASLAPIWFWIESPERAWIIRKVNKMYILYFNLVPYENCFHRRANNYTPVICCIFSNFTTFSISIKPEERERKLLLLKQQGNKKGSKLLLNSTRSCEFKRKGERSRVYFGNSFNDRAVGSNLNKTWRLMLRVKSTNKQLKKTHLIEI